MEILKKLRNNYNLTQKELAKKLSIEQNTLSQYESDKYPSFKILKKISQIFSTSLDFLILGNNCYYPRSLEFIYTAMGIKKNNPDDSIEYIKKTIKNLIPNIDNLDINIKKDNSKDDFDDNFHSNLKKLRISNNITQKQLSNKLNITESVISLYEKQNFPNIEKVIKISEELNCSIHALITGQKLFFDFKDKDFGRSILIADHLLLIEDKNFLVKLMSNLVKIK